MSVMVPSFNSAAKHTVSDNVGCACMVRPKSCASAPISMASIGFSQQLTRVYANNACANHAMGLFIKNELCSAFCTRD